MKKIYIETIAPFLRGLTFDGEKGNIIIFEDDLNKVSFDLIPKNIKLLSGKVVSDKDRSYNLFPLYLKTIKNDLSLERKELEKKIINHLIKKFKIYIEKYKQSPRVTIVQNIGIFYLGDSYNDTINTKNEFEAIEFRDNLEKSHLKETTKRSCDENTEETSNKKEVDRNDIVKDKIAVVTGGAQGFGERIVRNLTKSKCLVFIADINIEGASRLARELNNKYKKVTAFPVKVDVTDENSVIKMIYEIVKNAGGIDIFISNAGVLQAGSVKEMDFNKFTFVNRVNYFGYFLCVKHASKIMAIQNKISGRYFTDIIQINSKSGIEGANENSAYAGSKFGGLGLTQSFALELIEDNIKVNSICPGNFFEGPLWSKPENGLFLQYLQFGKVPGAKTIEDVKKFYETKVPMERGCTGEDVMKAIYYLIDQKYETGQAIPVTGGEVMLK